MADETTPILIGIDEQSWEKQLDSTEQWFGRLLLVQSAFREAAEKTADKIGEEHIKTAILKMAERAQQHEQQILRLYELIGRKAPEASGLTGKAAGTLSSSLASMKSLFGEAGGYWQDLHQLLLLNMNAMSAFGMAEQLGLALGLTEVAETVFPIMSDKQMNHLLLQEYSLELGAVAVLYGRDFG
ncbi:hypothetical protein [Indiicoccus explosivorum]|uniref:hypothetical protein n=1 Tax=Indiicoccus explosivorum TaxID=1917864 RepID=UPI000B4388CB|nr:hypothetical protein [Indiicoccus explosivorum]